MVKACVLVVLTTVSWGCALPGAPRREPVEWPDEGARKSLVPFTEAGAALAAAAAIREMMSTNPYPDLFSGCSSPEQGLDVAVYTGPTQGLYYVLVDQRFDRCGGPSVRVLDGWYAYAVNARGEVVGKAPPLPAADDFMSPVPLGDSAAPQQPVTAATPPSAMTPSTIPLPSASTNEPP